MNRWDETFDSMDPQKQAIYLRSQELDVIRIPPFNVKSAGVETYYQGFDYDGAYSYVGDEVTSYSAKAEEEIALGQTLY